MVTEEMNASYIWKLRRVAEGTTVETSDFYFFNSHGKLVSLFFHRFRIYPTHRWSRLC